LCDLAGDQRTGSTITMAQTQTQTIEMYQRLDWGPVFPGRKRVVVLADVFRVFLGKKKKKHT